ncbi:MAG: HD-GYP domain-containing protein [Actinomycetota bacterium]|nr:HD-GYP domain-containing protein [Actinomycetota bacterium]
MSPLDRLLGLARRGRGLGLGQGGLAILALLLVAPTVLLASLRAFPQVDVVFESAAFHLMVVTAIAACALLVALVAALVAARARHPSLVLLALGCVCIGVLMLGHGLTTPGILGRPVNMWVARFPVLAMAGFALSLAAALAREGSLTYRFVARYPRRLLVVVVAFLTGGTAFIIARPDAILGAPFPGEDLVTRGLVVVSGIVFLAAGTVHYRRWRLGGDRIEMALMLASWLSADALVAFQFGQLWRVSWWDYHIYLLAGFAAAAWAVLVGFRRTRSVEGALASISVRDPLEHISRGYPEALHALVGAVEAKDRYIQGHSARVADLSTRIGLHMGLSPDSLRSLSTGAVLHDIGKIGVPDGVLNKPGVLTDEEWEWIRTHPVSGWEMARRAPSLRDALAVIRHHHERWDGSGYPDGLMEHRIPMTARVATVADVWDALTSDRAYRPAWPAEAALRHIVEARGSLFDPSCVEAFVDLMVEQQNVSMAQVPVDPRVLESAAQACHPRGDGVRSSSLRQRARTRVSRH